MACWPPCAGFADAGGDRGGLATDYTEVVRLKDPRREVAYCPAIEVLPGGRIVATMLTHEKGAEAGRDWVVGVYTSDDRGASWLRRKELPMVDGQPFAAGGAVYVIGGREDLFISRSDDGTTWSDLIPLKTGRQWYSFPGPPIRANGRIYLEKECRTEPVTHGFPVWLLAPVVMSAPVDADLTRPGAWTFSNVLGFHEVLARYGEPNLLGAPFHTPKARKAEPGVPVDHGIGWGEGNLVQIHDPAHVWHDATGKTLHIFLRAETGRSGIAAIAKAACGEDGSITVDLERAPSGQPVLFVPLPGGQGAFNILYDVATRMYWLLSSQSLDSMRKRESLGPWHYGLPYNERSRIALYFSRNCMDWCFAGIVADGGGERRSFFHASAIIDGEDLAMVMRVADESAANQHDSNIIAFQRVRGFRALVH